LRRGETDALCQCHMAHGRPLPRSWEGCLVLDGLLHPGMSLVLRSRVFICLYMYWCLVKSPKTEPFEGYSIFFVADSGLFFAQMGLLRLLAGLNPRRRQIPDGVQSDSPSRPLSLSFLYRCRPLAIRGVGTLRPRGRRTHHLRTISPRVSWEPPGRRGTPSHPPSTQNVGGGVRTPSPLLPFP